MIPRSSAGKFSYTDFNSSVMLVRNRIGYEYGLKLDCLSVFTGILASIKEYKVQGELLLGKSIHIMSHT